MIRFLLEGWDSDAGKATSIQTSLRTTVTPHGDIEWMRIEIPKLRFYNNAHMYLIQGMPIAQLLMSMSVVSLDGVTMPGPLLYVCGFPSEMWQVPFCYHGLVVGRAIQVPEKMTTSEVLLALFNDEMERKKKK